MEIEPELVAQTIANWNQIIKDLKAWASLVENGITPIPAYATS